MLTKSLPPFYIISFHSSTALFIATIATRECFDFLAIFGLILLENPKAILVLRSKIYTILTSEIYKCKLKKM